jgi:DNA helicase-2/ATP-dependent DNA helicase PcrA
MNERELRQHGMKGKDAVVLSSIEAAKGLEFDHVIMPGLNKGEFALGGASADNRNLLYVGMTRARHRLTLLCDPARPSKYLIDAGLM